MTAHSAVGPLLARLARPRTENRHRLAVIADPHVTEGTGTWKVAHRSEARFERACDFANSCDMAVLLGDLTGDGRADSFERVESCLSELSVPRVAVPGNHDVPKAFDEHSGIPVSAFAERYTPGLPFTWKLGGVTLVGIDTATDRTGALRDTWGGRVGATTRRWLSDTLPGLEQPIVLLHHNLGSLPENPGGNWANFPVDDARETREILVANDVALVLSAHHHVPAVLDHRGPKEVIAPAVCSYPQAMLDIRIGPSGTDVRLAPLADATAVAEARRHARRGKPLAVGILESIDRRLGDLPLETRG
ncbi:metallophosphoesterase [Haloarcula sp. S1CR25-12]|uniref:Metallophosphoesterase n=1 Tax=Haloarcula saliterrae TaxID=2950534 RepID=A0ABU2FFI2_9EURY|nr:metallophosphoesterase [Haloarcula sp. S1CR25-12]MDS0260575.1 metallophosphoesterase [Haloarcula sp. S1CR25-12]